MKAITLSLLLMTLALRSFAQAPATPANPPSPAQPTAPQSTAPTAAPATPATPATAPIAAVAPTDSPVAVANSKIEIPKETTIPMVLLNTINTRSAYVGQSIYCESIFPISVGNRIIIPKGTSIRGTVTEVIHPGRVKGRAQLGLRFDEMILPNGTTRHLRATLSGFGSAGDDKFKPKEGQIEGGGSKGEDAEKIARTTLPAAEIGTIVGATKGGALEGLGVGSAIGAATGIAWILATRGKEIVLPNGTSLELQLLQPVNFDRDEVEPPSRYDAGPVMQRHEYGVR